MYMYVPDIGDTIKLSRDWKFELYPEYRNNSFINASIKHGFIVLKRHPMILGQIYIMDLYGINQHP